jgi:poly-gamma-glutamate synthesis protein (capsule biosynthesis protein)
MAYVGAAASEEEKQMPVIKEINGIRVAFLAYTETLNGNEKKVDAAATRYGVNLVTQSSAKKDVEAAKMAGADVVVCYVSWGEMLNRNATENQKKIAKVLVSAGVDVIIGCNPHVVQPALWLETTGKDGKVHRTLCLCATGNFLSDQRAQYADSGIIFEFTIQETGSNTGEFTITNPIYIPTYVWRAQGEGEKYVYHTLAVGQWLEEQPEGMAYTDVTRMKAVWAEIQNVMGDKVATIAAE